ncbi:MULTISPECIES: restriction endonuclease [Lysobacter]|uniref:restriction endonuclease n=1 Tax=Lysobacter TaxID=68 RepID=UPI001F31FA3E|nr:MULTISPECIES: restriction endonuclease [Lysobacter]UJB19194.1 restriction endonuclease [Lysobacter capsici]UJQ27081.1 restriction endonuclease [Lysobacter gummosus]
MSTAAKGTAFEDRVHAALAKELANGRLGLNPSTATLHKQKGYYSRDRESHIVLDVSIEVWLPSAPNWSMLWACECKDYSKSIPVDDIEEFKAKLDQISGANRKGVIATTSSLQSSALKYATAQGIGVVRLLPSNQVEHVLYQMSAGSYPDRLTNQMVLNALLVQHFKGRNNAFFGAVGNRIHDSWGSVLREDLRLST